MHCRGCEAAIESAVNELDAIRSVRAHLAQDKVTVTWDDDMDSSLPTRCHKMHPMI
ncbi:hypothetical protein METHB2_880001 [Candidatus Methylobacter favarea]|uniref:HMA domain-containing protein n=2 Tax=Candidatus Methylobacter favarea TaxID=2707345 RepID=A0A8S0XJ30_9GAMM|nr:hypothetical protein METHB2_880001 [Candidatus Methylobacter favarea]